MEKKNIFRLIKQSGVYALGNVAIKVSGLLLAPFLLDTTFLGLAEYGQLGILLIFAQLSIQFGGMGLGTGLLKFVGKGELANPDNKSIFTAFATSVVSSSLFYLLLISKSDSLSNFIFGSPSHTQIIRYIGIYIICKIIASIPLMVLRIQERAGVYTAAIVLEMAVLLGAIYFLLVVQRQGITGIVLGYAIASSISMSVVVYAIVSRVKWNVDFALIKSLLSYGAPLVFVGLANIILNAGDRFVLKAITNDEEVGMYEWAARMSGVLNLFVVQSFQLAFTVIGLKVLGSGDNAFHKRIFRHYIVFAGWAALGISLLSYELTLLLNGLGASDHYLKSTQLVFPLAIGILLYGIFVIINNVLYATSKTNLMSRNVIMSAVFNIVLNIFLIPIWGAAGAAIATVLSYGVLLGLTWISSRNEISIPYAWNDLLKVLMIVACLYFAGQYVVYYSFFGVHFLRLGILMLYPVSVIIFGIYGTEEIKTGLQLMTNFLKGRGTIG